MSDQLIEHSNLPPQEVHLPYNFIFNTSLERESFRPRSNQINGIALQLDDRSLWLLVSSAPSWRRIILQGDPTNAGGNAGGDLRGTFPNPSVQPDSHYHTPGITIPIYPSTLPPNGPARGDLDGLYPDPILRTINNNPGTYTNASITVDAKGRVISAASGEELLKPYLNVGTGLPIHKNKINDQYYFHTLGVESNSGLSISLANDTLVLNTPGVLKLTGGILTGNLRAPSINTSTIDTTHIKQGLHPAGTGTNWNPDILYGNYQSFIFNGAGLLGPIANAYPGLRVQLVLAYSTNQIVNLASNYKFPQGMDRDLSSQSGRIDMLEVLVMSTSLYLCKLHKNFT